MDAFKKLYYLFFTIVLGLATHQLIASEKIVITNPDQLLIIGKNISYFEDQRGTMTLGQILQPENQQQFVIHEKEVFNRPGTESAFWFKIIAQNYSEEDSWLEVGSNYAWYVDFYIADSSGNYSHPIETGTLRPEENKLYDVNLFWLPMNKAHESESKTYYMRVKSGLTFELPLRIGTIRSLTKNKLINDYLTAGFIGIIMVMLLYNLLIYISTKDHIYIFYLGYLFVMAFAMPYANGYPFIQNLEFLFIDKYWWNEHFLVWHTSAYFFVGAFCIRYLNLKKKAPLMRKIIQAEIALLAIVFPLFNLFGVPFVQLVNSIQVLLIAFYLSCLFTGYYFVFKGFRQAYFYSFGWTFMVGGTMIFFAAINGYLPINTFTRNSLYFGTAIEVCLFALALAGRLNELRQSKEEAERENIRLITAQNEELEKVVKIRTSELQKANKELIQSNKELMVSTEKLDAQSKELITANKAKDQIFAIIAHDLRSPINSLKGILDLMYTGRISREEFMKFSINAKHSVEHTHFMLNNLLTWAKFQLQGMTTNPEMVTIKNLFDENIRLFDISINKKSIMVVNDAPVSVKALADPNHVNIIIHNLLSNALKFTETGGKVSLDATRENGSCIITISDSGVGIPEDLIQDIFAIKSSKSNVGTEGEKGTGLGLALCKDFIEKNNGNISVVSKKYEGTTFTIELPSFNN